eukprot:6787627-Karenia_brevis.AAC.1
MAKYGVEGQGMSPTVMHKMRTIAANAVGTEVSGRCPITTIAITIGPSRDPGIQAPLEHLKHWFWLRDQYTDGTEQHAELAVAWMDQAKALAQAPNIWSHVKGPMGATQMYMVQAGWRLTNIDVWHDPQGDTWEYKSGGPVGAFMVELQQSLLTKMWEAAAGHRHGQGMELGVDCTGISKQYMYLANKGLMSQAGLLIAIAAGALWPMQRRAETYPVENVCPLCGSHNHDEQHMFWECSEINRQDDHRITRSNYLIPQARAAKEHGEVACYFLRGLMPIKWTLPSEEPRGTTVPLGSGSMLPRLEYIKMYTDGSGGRNSNDPRIRRCGWAWVVVRRGTDIITHGEAGHLPGAQWQQTVPRSELHALTQSLKAISAQTVLTRVDICTDCLTAVTGWTKGKHATRSSDIADAWEEF